MKKLIPMLFAFALLFSLAACNSGAGEGGTDKESSNSVSTHKHHCKKVEGKDATCLEEGKLTYWDCIGCDMIFNNQYLEKELSLDEVIIPKLPHTISHIEGNEATCDKAGNIEYWKCDSCTTYFADEAATTEISDKKSVIIASQAHQMTHTPEKRPSGKNDGNIEYWYCNVCENYYKDADGKQGISLEETILLSAYKIPDFVVEVPAGREPIVLQLSDTQIIDAGQTRPGRDGVYYDFWATDQIEERCYDYLTEVITATKPDFIILTGDVVYGEFDDSGTALESLIAFMESFKIPWAPVFGNHDNESKKGVDWQCAQFEAAKYCLFDQKELSGNGNYSVAIAQSGEIKRVFYMMDTNACGNASAESIANGHTYPSYCGFMQDQIDWYTAQITELKKAVPEIKISFAYHIQQAIFGKAYAKYGFNQAVKNQGENGMGINIDTNPDKAEGDFGYIGRQMKGPWDTNYAVFNAMKNMGVDSIFVGHEHCNNVSVVYEGVRFQYGLKSSEYDRFNCIDSEGNITGGYSKTGTSLIGGTVIVLSEDDGVIEDTYNYYCGFENGEINWKKYEKIAVNGLKYGGVQTNGSTTAELFADGAVVAEGVWFDENTTAYKVTANQQGKLYINTNLMRGKTKITFNLYIPSTCTSNMAGMGPFAIRLKPDDGSAANIAGILNANGKYYINYNWNSSVEEVKLVADTWKTYTVDISDIADTCTEFAFNIAVGNVFYLRDITVS